jgi:hypothetical protein
VAGDDELGLPQGIGDPLHFLVAHFLSFKLMTSAFDDVALLFGRVAVFFLEELLKKRICELAVEILFLDR